MVLIVKVVRIDSSAAGHMSRRLLVRRRKLRLLEDALEKLKVDIRACRVPEKLAGKGLVYFIGMYWTL